MHPALPAFFGDILRPGTEIDRPKEEYSLSFNSMNFLSRPSHLSRPAFCVGPYPDLHHGLLHAKLRNFSSVESGMNREASTRDEESPRACPCKWTVEISPRGGGADGEGVSPSPVSTASWGTRNPHPARPPASSPPQGGGSHGDTRWKAVLRSTPGVRP